MKHLYFMLIITLAACGGDSSVGGSNEEGGSKIDTTTHNKYTWHGDYDYKNNIVNRITPPLGFDRVEVEKGSFADWLRHLPLKPDSTEVLLHTGAPKPNQNIHEAVINIDTGEKDLQQCADAIMRLKGEYHFSRNEFNKIHFNYTMNDTKVAFTDWATGAKPIPVPEQNLVYFFSAHEEPDYSYTNFKRYMESIFNYAGTISLRKEMKQVLPHEVQIGDVFIQGGSPGHAVLVVDMVTSYSGEKRFLLAQSYMPAQDIHLLKNTAFEHLSPWHMISGMDLKTPEWDFTINDIRRFR